MPKIYIKSFLKKQFKLILLTIFNLLLTQYLAFAIEHNYNLNSSLINDSYILNEITNNNSLNLSLNFKNNINENFEKQESICIKFDDVSGSGKFPYNFRIIDNKLLAGGNLFNPRTHANSPERVKKYLILLKMIGAKHIIALNVPLNSTYELDIIKKYCDELNLNFYKCRMTAEIVPNSTQTAEILQMIEEGAYVHCNWGCDRTGAIIAKYLVLKKGYSGEEAFKAVITGGSHSGKLGGLKQTPMYKNLILYFWPDIKLQNKDIAKKYNI